MSQRSSIERYLPVAYLVLSVLLVAVLLPTAMRPPQPPPPTSAEFSPDAPPDEDHEVILSELARGTTTTAGVGEEIEVGDGGVAAITEPLVELAPRRGLCFGDPPRQAESIYSPPCAPAWTGDNGGHTWQGVTPTEIRIAVFGETADVGRVPSEAQPGESPELRTLRVFQSYFNERFELYNRRLQLHVISAERRDGDGSGADVVSGPPADSQRAAVTQADEEFEVFGIVNESALYVSAEHESLRRELVHMGRGWQPHSLFRNNAPFAWSFRIELEMQADMTAEIVCKQMGTDPPSFNNEQDPSFDYSAPRVYGLMEYRDQIHRGLKERFDEGFANCGLQFEEYHTANLGDSSDQMAGGVQKMRSAGVTTIIVATDPVAAGLYANEAQQSHYYPEWVHVGGAGQDLNAFAGLYPQRQWQHAIGIRVSEIPSGRRSGGDHTRAYQEIEPGTTPTGYNEAWFWQMLHMVAGFQLAGPELTPHTFQQGMHTAWPPRPPEPSWTIGGSYQPGKWAFTSYVALQWWDPDAPRPGSTAQGAYRHPYNGKRFKQGEIPTDPIPFFEHGDPSHITEAPPNERI